jgi:hypothetical protein
MKNAFAGPLVVMGDLGRRVRRAANRVGRAAFDVSASCDRVTHAGRTGPVSGPRSRMRSRSGHGAEARFEACLPDCILPSILVCRLRLRN